MKANKLSITSARCFAAIVRRPDPLGRLVRRISAQRTAILRSAVVLAVAAVPRLANLAGHSLGPDELLWSDCGRAMVFNVRVH